ncbi:MAG TPA: outer membrane beta-barrel protein [Bacteroidales bacterium]|nr:outer membrane beta-barrel protein [Bacteroidales bacterium]
MDRSNANIDLVFRNGLKDFEVLPPELAWKKIKPSIYGRKRVAYFRTAALVAAFASIGIVAFFLGRSSTTSLNDSFIAFNISQEDPYYSVQPFRINSESSIPAGTNIHERGSELQAPSADFIQTDEIVLQTVSQRQLVQPVRRAEKTIMIPDISEPLYSDYLSRSKPVVTRRWSVEAMASPTYYSMMGAGGNNFSRQLLASEKPISSYTGGLTVSYRINRRFTIQTGLFYASQGQKLAGVYSYAGFQAYSESKGTPNFELRTASGPVQTGNADVFISVRGDPERITTQYTNDVFDPEKSNLTYLGNELIQSFNYLQMPLILRYKVIDKTLDINLTGGVSYDFLIRNDAYTDVNGIKYLVGDTKGINTLALSSSFGMGFEYGLTDKISLNLEPTFRYFLNPFNEPTQPGIHPYSFGVFSGFSFRF